MSQSGSQAWAFYRDVALARILWTISDAGGFPAPQTESGRRAMPFWSTLARAEKVIATVPAYSGFRPKEISWSTFCQNWVPGLTRDGLLVGVNWSGARATGFDLEPAHLEQHVEALIADPRQMAPE